MLGAAEAFEHDLAYGRPQPTDELWRVDVTPGYAPPFADRQGFSLTIECDEREYAIPVLECPLEGGRRLWVAPESLPRDELETCALKVSLYDEGIDTEWFSVDYVLLHSDLRAWIAPLTRSDPP